MVAHDRGTQHSLSSVLTPNFHLFPTPPKPAFTTIPPTRPVLSYFPDLFASFPLISLNSFPGTSLH